MACEVKLLAHAQYQPSLNSVHLSAALLNYSRPRPPPQLSELGGILEVVQLVGGLELLIRLVPAADVDGIVPRQ